MPPLFCLLFPFSSFLFPSSLSLPFPPSFLSTRREKPSTSEDAFLERIYEEKEAKFLFHKFHRYTGYCQTIYNSMYIKNILIIIHLYSEMELFPLFLIVRQLQIVLRHSSFWWKMWNSFSCLKFPKTPFLPAFPVVEHLSPVVESIFSCSANFPQKKTNSFLKKKDIPSLCRIQ